MKIRPFKTAAGRLNMTDQHASPRWLRRGVIALSTLTLCSCRTPDRHHRANCPPGAQAPVAQAPAQSAATPMPQTPLVQRPPMPAVLLSNWAPAGMARPWPSDEYLHDGGDQNTAARVDAEWRVHG